MSSTHRPTAAHLGALTMFAYVSFMNEQFGNPRGNPTDLLPLQKDAVPGGPLYDAAELTAHNAAWAVVEKQALGIKGELKELYEAINTRDADKTRDALCDIVVFALGTFHRAGLDAEADMQAVLDGVMTRFCANGADVSATFEKWHARGVLHLSSGGAYPHAYVKARGTQTAFDGEVIADGKFLKSVNTREPIFAPIHPRVFRVVETRQVQANPFAAIDDGITAMQLHKAKPAQVDHEHPWNIPTTPLPVLDAVGNGDNGGPIETSEAEAKPRPEPRRFFGNQSPAPQVIKFPEPDVLTPDARAALEDIATSAQAAHDVAVEQLYAKGENVVEAMRAQRVDCEALNAAKRGARALALESLGQRLDTLTDEQWVGLLTKGGAINFSFAFGADGQPEVPAA